MTLWNFVDPVYLTVSGIGPIGALLLPAVQRGGFNWAMHGAGCVRVSADGSVRPAITDGTSNTVLFGEQPLGIRGNTSGSVGPTGGRNRGLPGVTDGTSNTFLVGEGPASTSGGAPGLGGARGRNNPALPAITDGTSNTILLGEQATGSGSVRPGIADGTSNTIFFAETKPSQAMLNPMELGGSFRVLVPSRLASMLHGHHLRLRMRHGFTHHGLDVSGAHATQFQTGFGGRVLVTITAHHIIAILIGL